MAKCRVGILSTGVNCIKIAVTGGSLRQQCNFCDYIQPNVFGNSKQEAVDFLISNE